jgi:hypothetical protein
MGAKAPNEPGQGADVRSPACGAKRIPAMPDLASLGSTVRSLVLACMTLDDLRHAVAGSASAASRAVLRQVKAEADIAQLVGQGGHAN